MWEELIQLDVDRRIGGLEIPIIACPRKHPVDRRIGGLEKQLRGKR